MDDIKIFKLWDPIHKNASRRLECECVTELGTFKHLWNHIIPEAWNDINPESKNIQFDDTIVVHYSWFKDKYWEEIFCYEYLQDEKWNTFYVIMDVFEDDAMILIPYQHKAPEVILNQALASTLLLTDYSYLYDNEY